MAIPSITDAVYAAPTKLIVPAVPTLAPSSCITTPLPAAITPVKFEPSP